MSGLTSIIPSPRVNQVTGRIVTAAMKVHSPTFVMASGECLMARTGKSEIIRKSENWKNDLAPL
jgi:hypothetical protein